jgi:TolB-like protein/class 3 adenylate cyclase/cytochrome c-type biogenesis protein CcmH/NrfG
VARSERRLAAIVAVDVVGYAQLMGHDEAGTLHRLLGHRAELIDPAIAAHGGRIVKTMGDGLLLEFASVVAAVQCAMAIQVGMRERQSDDAAGGMWLRIGVHLGDVIIEGDDVFGEGVNIAARLQEVAAPGGLAVSGQAYDHLDETTGDAFADAGAAALKHIRRPVQVWCWRGAPPAAVDAAAGRDRPSVAVLPFGNMTGDPDQEYFADGIAEDIITELSRFRAIVVIARSSSFGFRDPAAPASRIAAALGARYLLDGSVRRARGRVRVSARLVDAGRATQLWAERYDRELDDVFAVQDEIARAVVAAVAPQFLHAEVERAARKKDADLDAWDLVMRARWHMGQFTREGNAAARDLLRDAIARDPRSAPALSQLAHASLWAIPYGWTDSVPEALSLGAAAARQAVELDGSDAVAHATLGIALAFQRRHADALAACRRAVALNPNLAMAHGCLCLVASLTGERSLADDSLAQALRLSPLDADRPLWYAGAAAAAFEAGDYGAAIRLDDQAIDANPNLPTAYRQRAAAHAMLDQLEEARADVAVLLRLIPGNSLRQVRQQLPYRPEALEQFLAALRRAGLPET